MLKRLVRNDEPTIPVALELRHSLEARIAGIKKRVRNLDVNFWATVIQQPFNGIMPRSGSIIG
jgi:hypothetical protein